MALRDYIPGIEERVIAVIFDSKGKAVEENGTARRVRVWAKIESNIFGMKAKMQVVPYPCVQSRMTKLSENRKPEQKQQIQTGRCMIEQQQSLGRQKRDTARTRQGPGQDARRQLGHGGNLRASRGREGSPPEASGDPAPSTWSEFGSTAGK